MKKQNVYERKMKILLEVLLHSPPSGRKNDLSPSLSHHGLCNMLLCESLSGNHPGRKTHPCPSSDVQIAADLTSNPKFAEVAGVRANFIISLPGPQLLPGFLEENWSFVLSLELDHWTLLLGEL